jgi:hypothetical protein
MAISGVKMLGQAFSEDAEPLERLTLGLSGLSMVLPGLSLAY